MATVQLTDVYNPLVFAQAEQELQIELNRFISSGVAVIDPRINAMASQGGNIGELPFYKPLGTDEPNYSNDNPADNSTPQNVTDSKMVYRLASQNASWSTMDLARELALSDPAAAITGRIAQYWATNNERRIIQSIRGVTADNIDNYNGDMVFDISAGTDTVVDDSNLIDADAIVDAVQTMGDHKQNIGIMACHSVVKARLQKLNLIDFIPDSQGVIVDQQYMGYSIIEDDSLAGVTYGTTPENTYYDTIFFGAGQIALGEGRVQNASELDRDPSSGNGGGQSILYSRRSDIIHPAGFTFESAAVAGQSATQAELAQAVNWDRVFERKNIALAILRSNG